MKPVRVLLLASCTAIPGLAQAPGAASPRAPMPLRPSASFDVAAALADRWRVSIEPLVVGRFTFGLSGAVTRTPDAADVITAPLYRPGSPLASYIPCLPENVTYCYPVPAGEPRYRATSLGFQVRWYPAALSRDLDGQRFGLYLGESLTYDVRRVRWPEYIMPPIAVPDSGVVVIIPRPAMPVGTQHVRGWEPGAELGARLMLGKRVLLEVGGAMRWVTLNDPLEMRQPGSVAGRFNLALGVAW